MGVEDVLVMLMYMLSFGGFAYIAIKFNKYYRGRFKAGVINRFMLGALFFMCSYSYKMVVAFLIRFSKTSDMSAAREALYTHHWTAAMVMTTISILILANIVRTDSWNAWYDLRRFYPWSHRKGKKQHASEKSRERSRR